MEMNNINQYAAFLEKRKTLADILDRSSAVIHDLNMSQFGQNLKQLAGKVDNDTFKIQVVGSFNNGKSTFINSLLGEYVLPAYSVPTTAVINEVKYDKEKRAVLYFRNPLPDRLPANIPEKALSHIEAHNRKDVPPLEIKYDEIEDYVVIPMDADMQEMLLESPYEKVELFWPLPLLENGVEIIDSPGLNEAEIRNKVTMDYLSKADAILFVLNAQAACSMQEMDFIRDNLKEQGFEDPFFVVNRWDCIPDREKPRLERFVNLKLGEFSTNKVYFISSLQALEAKEQQDNQKYQASGVAEFETRLSDFLTRQKGKAKLAQPARELKRILTNEALFKVIPQQRQMLNTSLDELRSRYEAAKPRLDALQLEKEQMLNKMQLRIEQCRTEFKRLLLHNSASLIDSITGWVDECQPTTTPGIIPSKAKITAMAQEISDYVAKKVEDNQHKWQHEVFLPLVEERAKAILDSIEADLSNLYDEIDTIKVEISGGAQALAQKDDVPLWERVTGAMGGFLLGGLGGAVTGSTSGLSKELAKSIVFNITGFLALYWIGALNPVTGIALIIGTILVGNPSKNITSKVKQSIVEELTKKVQADAEQNSEAAVTKIVEKLNAIVHTVKGAVNVEIDEAKKQVQTIIADMEKGKSAMDTREKTISRCEESIQQLNTELDALIFQLVEE